VRDPWLGPTNLTLSGRGSRAFRVTTPLDGAFRVTLSTRAGNAYRVSAPATVCGQRSILVRVHRLRGNQSFRLTVSRP
jgi:hypothetical protein